MSVQSFVALSDRQLAGDDIPIGAIVHCAIQDQNFQDALKSLRFSPTTWQPYDQLFRGRIDYRLWRLWAEIRDPAGGHSALALHWTSLLNLVEEALQEPNGLWKWGALSVASRALSRTVRQHAKGILLPAEMAQDPARSLLLLERAADQAEICVPPEGLAPSAASIRIILRRVRELARLETGLPPSMSANEYTSLLVRDLREIDGAFCLSHRIRFGGIAAERLNGGSLQTGPTVGLAYTLISCLESTRTVLASDHEILAAQHADLLAVTSSQIFLLCLTAHETHRWIRSHVRQGRANGVAWALRIPEAELRKAEVRSLVGLAEAADEAGWAFDHVASGFALLHQMPMLDANSRPSEAVLTRVREHLAEVGLRAPENGGVRDVGMPTTEVTAGTGVWPRSDMHCATLYSSQMSSQPWSTLLGLAAELKDETLIASRYEPARFFSRLVDLVKAGVVHDSNVITAGATVALQLGYMRSGIHLLAGASASILTLRILGDALSSAMRTQPLGLQVNLVQEWQTSLRAHWARVASSRKVERGVSTLIRKDPIVGLRVVLHEVLSGRALSVIHETAQPTDVLKNFYEPADDEELSRALDDMHSASFRVPPPPTIRDIRHMLENWPRSGLSLAGCASLVIAGRGTVSGIVVTKAEATAFDTQFERDVDRNVADICNVHHDWSDNVPWGVFRELGAQVVALATKATVAGAPIWIALAVDPTLARLPWQHLFSQLCRGTSTRVIVSIVPSFGWLLRAAERQEESGGDKGGTPKTSIFLKPADDELARLGRAIERDVGTLLAPVNDAGIAVIGGHGRWSDSEQFPTITVKFRTGNRPLTARDWLHLMTRRVCIVHACHGGRTRPHLLNDFSAVPAVAFALGCRCLIAPLSEPGMETALTLQRSLFGGRPTDIGSRYLEAIASEPNVAFYALYGLANEPFLVTTGEAPNGQMRSHAIA